MRKKGVTIKELAKMLNLSVSTVSRALHGHARISEATIKRVKEVANELGYEPNQTALFLQSGKTMTLGVILPHLSEAFFSEAISGIEDLAVSHGYNVLIGQSHDNTDKEQSIAEAMKNHRVDGMLVSIAKSTSTYDHFEMLKKYGIPVVFFDRVPENFEAHTVSCRMETGMQEAVAFLVKRGHSKIAFVNGPKNLLATKERMRGYKTALRRNGIELVPEFVVHSDLTMKSTHHAMQRLLTLRKRPTAVITFNDYVALDAIQYSKRMNDINKKEISFVSFANLQICNYMETPPLASVEQFPYQQGQRAAEIMIGILNSGKVLPDKCIHEILEPRLVVHQS